MHPLSVGRFPHGLLFFAVLFTGAGLTQPIPAAVVTTPNATRTCATDSVAFPTVELDCTHRLEYVGQFSAEGTFSPLGRHRRWYNKDYRSSNFNDAGRPLARPIDVPGYVNLHSNERVVQNFLPPVRASQMLTGKTKLGGWRDSLLTFVYGKEQSLAAPQHLTMDSRGRVIVTDPLVPAVHVLDGKNSFRIAGGERRRLQKPNGVAVDADDNIYVVDSGPGLIQVYDPRGNFIRYIGKIDDESLFDYPTGIAIDRKNARMYLLDTPRNLLLVLDLQGHIMKRIGRRSSDEVPVEFLYPTEIALSGDELVVLDSSGSRLQVFNLEGKLLRQINTFTSTAPGLPKMAAEMGLGADAEGNIYLTNFRDSGVRVFTREGKVINSFGRRGALDGQFNCPSGVWVEKENLYISDTNNRRISVYKIHSLVGDMNKVVSSTGP